MANAELDMALAELDRAGIKPLVEHGGRVMPRNFGFRAPPREQSSTAFTGATVNALVGIFVFGAIILNSERIAEVIRALFDTQ